jgi:hypothetical protein
MKKGILALLIFGASASVTFGQTTFSSYRGSWSPYAGYYNFKSDFEYVGYSSSETTKIKSSGYTLGCRGSSSIISLLFDDDSKFYFGDFIGGDMGVSTMKRNYKDEAAKSSFGVTIGFDLGLSAGYAISDRLEIGVQVIFLRGNITTDLDNFLTFTQKSMVIPSIKFENAMLMFGYGKGGIGGDGFGDLEGKGLFIEPRFFNDDSNRYVFVRYERNWASETTTTTNTWPSNYSTSSSEAVKGTVVSLGIGFTY